MVVVYHDSAKTAVTDGVSHGGVEGTRETAPGSALVIKEQVFRHDKVAGKQSDQQGSGSVVYTDKYALAAKSRHIFRTCLRPHKVYDADGVAHDKYPAVALCCTARPDADGVTVYADKDQTGHGMGNVVHCSSMWACPVCAPYIASGRGEEIRRSLEMSTERRYGVEFVTLTVRHSRDDALAWLLSLLQDAWKSVMTCRRMRKFKEEHGFLAYVRRTEVTYSIQSGFHPHYHALCYFDHALTDQEHEEFAGLVALLWQRFLTRHEGDGADRSLNAHGYQVEKVDLSDAGQVKVASYVSKISSVGGLSFELGDGGNKEGRDDGSFSMFQVLRLINIKDRDWKKSWQCRVWLDYYRATKGRKVFCYSSDYRKNGELVHAGFKTLFHLKDKDDEEIAEEQSEKYHGRSEVVGILSRDAWRRVTSMPVDDQGRFHDDLRRDDVSGFDRYGLTALQVSVRDDEGGRVYDRTSWGVPLWIGVSDDYFCRGACERDRVMYALRRELLDALTGSDVIDVRCGVIDDGDGCPAIDGVSSQSINSCLTVAR